jgi:NADH-quinone oxidoreductase subunit M
MLLSSLIGLPLLGAGIISFLPEKSVNDIRRVGLLTSGITFMVSLLLWVLFDASTAD